MPVKIEVTEESEHYCPCCGERSLLRDCQVELFDDRRTWWCLACRAEFKFEFIHYGLPLGGFRVVQEADSDIEWHEDIVEAT